MGVEVPRILLIEDEVTTAHLISRTLTGNGKRLDVRIEYSSAAGIDSLDRYGADCVLLDYDLPDRNGLETLAIILQKRPNMPVIVVTGEGSGEVAAEFMKLGAKDYVQKSKDFGTRLLAKLHRVLNETRQPMGDSIRVGGAPVQEAPFDKIVGASASLRESIAIARQACATDAGVLIEGETGTGKDLLSRAIHDGSRRRAKRFLAQNCAAIPESLLESILFGHMRGTFTGAAETRAGLLEEANGGTLFLDEIGEASPTCQTKLLDVIEKGEVAPLGSSRGRPIDVRIIAATNRNLPEDVQTGRFRRDLYHRLKVVTIQLPPLRNRIGDVEILAETFLREFCTEEGKGALALSREALGFLRHYDWPGNVRELKNEIHRLVVATPPGKHTIDASLLDHPILNARDESGANRPLKEMMSWAERGAIEERLNQYGGNKSAAARSLKISREWLRQRMAKHGLG